MNGRNLNIKIEFIPCAKHNYVTPWNQEEETNLTRGRGEGREPSEVKVMGVGQERKHLRRGNRLSEDVEAGSKVHMGNC